MNIRKRIERLKPIKARVMVPCVTNWTSPEELERLRALHGERLLEIELVFGPYPENPSFPA